MALILVVEDEQDLQKVLAYNLRQAGHEVLATGSGREALTLAQKRIPQVVLLDVMLPDILGTEVCKALKRHTATRQIPVVMLTAKGEEIDRVVGFELGVEDYIVKPFSVRELLLRLDVILRRSKETARDEAAVTFGTLRIDRAAHRVWVDDGEIELTALEFRLLVTLYDRRDRVQDRGALLDDVWGLSPDITTRTVDTHVKRLREKLGPTAGAYIETVRGVGYRFASQPR